MLVVLFELMWFSSFPILGIASPARHWWAKRRPEMQSGEELVASSPKLPMALLWAFKISTNVSANTNNSWSGAFTYPNT